MAPTNFHCTALNCASIGVSTQWVPISIYEQLHQSHGKTCLLSSPASFQYSLSSFALRSALVANFYSETNKIRGERISSEDCTQYFHCFSGMEVSAFTDVDPSLRNTSGKSFLKLEDKMK